jgi:hypothetical protein
MRIGWDDNNQTAGINYGDFDYISNSYASYFKYENGDTSSEENNEKDQDFGDSNPKSPCYQGFLLCATQRFLVF